MAKKRGCYIIIKSSELNNKDWTPEYYIKKYPKKVRKLTH